MLALDIQKIQKKYANGTEALQGVTLQIEEGDFFGLLGSNGAGKTTLIGIVCGLVTPTAGSGKVFNFNIDTERDLAKQQIGIVPQEFNFNIFEKVWDIIITQAGYYGLTVKEATPHAEHILRKLDLWDKRDQPSRALSGGMKRRLLIARALVHKPRLLILDEPTAGVDVELRKGMWEYLTELNKNGTTIIMTTHYLEEIERLCRNLAIINKGEIVKSGSVSELLQGMDTKTYILTLDSGNEEITVRKDQDLSEVLGEFAKKGKKILDIRLNENRLEQLFLQTIRT